MAFSINPATIERQTSLHGSLYQKEFSVSSNEGAYESRVLCNVCNCRRLPDETANVVLGTAACISNNIARYFVGFLCLSYP